jgi:hypothetical protein
MLRRSDLPICYVGIAASLKGLEMPHRHPSDVLMQNPAMQAGHSLEMEGTSAIAPKQRREQPRQV